MGSRIASPSNDRALRYLLLKKIARPEPNGLLNAVVTWVSLPLHQLGTDSSILMRQYGAVEVGVMRIYQIKAVSSCSLA